MDLGLQGKCALVAFLVSERACWINGAMIPVDGAQERPSAFLRNFASVYREVGSAPGRLT
jgi:hypothetical protein